MNTKRIIEIGFILVFILGVGASIWIHQSYDEFLTQLVQASGRKIGGGTVEINNLRWQSAERNLSFTSGQWRAGYAPNNVWLILPAWQWQIPEQAWQGARFHTERISLAGINVLIYQEGLTTNINRLLEQVAASSSASEAKRKGEEALLFWVDQWVFTDVQFEFHTLKHGILRWQLPELVLALPPPASDGLEFDALLKQLALALLTEAKAQATAQLLALPISASQPPTKTNN